MTSDDIYPMDALYVGSRLLLFSYETESTSLIPQDKLTEILKPEFSAKARTNTETAWRDKHSTLPYFSRVSRLMIANEQGQIVDSDLGDEHESPAAAFAAFMREVEDPFKITHYAFEPYRLFKTLMIQGAMEGHPIHRCPMSVTGSGDVYDAETLAVPSKYEADFAFRGAAAVICREDLEPQKKMTQVETLQGTIEGRLFLMLALALRTGVIKGSPDVAAGLDELKSLCYPKTAAS